jgi:hypothetical protein
MSVKEVVRGADLTIVGTAAPDRNQLLQHLNIKISARETTAKTRSQVQV